jgi:hypothetical protein
MLGVATAESPTAPPIRTISVQGVAKVPVAQGADAASATAAYRAGMEAAVGDGKAKAEFLASKVGATLGAAQSVVEGSGSISCIGGEESVYVEYQGAQPDFGSPGTVVSPGVLSVGAAKPTLAPPLRGKRPSHRRVRHRTATGKAAATGACTLSTQVSLSYAIS